ncbi:MAG: AFG1 family ATPase [Coxiellaceae bacterium]|nr:AFG1 family ATPase [Coxiellaceae bacterium]
MTPLESYQKKLAAGEITQDPKQQAVMETLEVIYHNLVKRQKIRDSQIGQLRRKIKPRPPIKGLYMYGSVGVGKTFMLDTFYDCLPVRKIRLHFHAFMRQIHQSLKENQGIKNPLDEIARQIADDILIICFDEFFVSNIADAMILGELFTALFKGGVCLVTTSNIAPDDLYKNGIQRDRFLPAIEIIKTNVDVIHLDTQQDYRLRHIEKAGVYFTPLDSEAEKNMQAAFRHYAGSPNISTAPIEILGREIDIVKQANSTIWFDFYKICGRPRSQNDYLELAKDYDTFLISNVPIMDRISNDLIISFINLIDILYDNQKRLIISAEDSVTQLYSNNMHQVAFDRTESRLIEMQSEDYLNL